MLATPEWPFQRVCAGYFHHKGHNYLTIVNRFSGWSCIYHFKAGTINSMNLINIWRDLYIFYGAPVEFSSDGWPQFTAQVFQQFLQDWGIAHHLSLAGYPQPNGRAELGVKTSKRIILDNTNHDGSLNSGNAARVIHQCWNTPIHDLGWSRSQILFHRQLRDYTP